MTREERQALNEEIVDLILELRRIRAEKAKVKSKTTSENDEKAKEEET